MSEKNEWKLVPVVPTDDMEAAAEDDYEQTGATFPRWKSAYAAMLAAAPAAPSLSSLGGFAPGACDGMKSEDYVNKVRNDGWSSPDCAPAPSAPGDAQRVYHFEQRSRFGPWIEVEKPTAKSVEFIKRSAAPAAGDALPTIKGAAITGGYVVVTPAGWGEDKAQKVRDAILRLFPVNPAYTPKPETDIAAQQGKGGEHA